MSEDIMHGVGIITSIPGKGDTSEPVAMRIFLVFISSETDPFSSNTETVFALVIFP